MQSKHKPAAIVLVTLVVLSLILLLSFPSAITLFFFLLIVFLSAAYSQYARRTLGATRAIARSDENAAGVNAPGLEHLRYEESPAPTPKELQIKATQEIQREMSRFNVKLNDLLVAPYGIVHLIDDYQSHPTQERWNAIKERASENQNKLESAYKALEELKATNFFGQHPEIANEIERVIDAKMHRFYRELDRYPLTLNTATHVNIDHLRECAQELEISTAKVRNLQKAISRYLGELQSTTKDEENRLKAQQSRAAWLGRKNVKGE